MIGETRSQWIEENWDEYGSFSRSEVGAPEYAKYITRNGEFWDGLDVEDAVDNGLDEILPEWNGYSPSVILKAVDPIAYRMHTLECVNNWVHDGYLKKLED